MRDQVYYDQFHRAFADSYDLIIDDSQERAQQTENAEYMMHVIRETYVAKSACTIVLCGPYTPFRKYVDWEIDATLWEEHALIGVKLPHLLVIDDHSAKPARLQDNLDSGYAVWTWWELLMNKQVELAALIAEAKAKPKSLIRNKRRRRTENERL